MLNFITQKICAFSVTFVSASAFCESSMFVCSFELFRVLSRSLNRDKENITLENNMLENFAENSVKNIIVFKTTKIYCISNSFDKPRNCFFFHNLIFLVYF